ncbi:MAG: response regulator [Peptococcaceae bacterium]
MAVKVLIVDDAKFSRVMLKDILTKYAGLEVVGEAENGLEAVRKYLQLRPDLVTMDITMPEMDGIEALKQIRSFEPRCKIIMCSAMGQKEMIVEAIESGARDFIIKPFIKERVLEALQKVVKNN